MSVAPACGVVSISIDADHPSQHSTTHGESVESILVELIDRFNQHRAAAGWAFRDPADAPLAQRIAGGRYGHEVLLLGDETVLSQSICSRTDLLRTVVQRVHAAAEAGISISTLALQAAWRPQHIDLLTKHGVTMVRSPQPLANSLRIISRRGGEGVQTVCYGLWHLPVATTLRGGGWMTNLAQLRLVRRQLNRAAQCGGMCHLRIDAVSLAQGDVPSGLRTIDRLLRDFDRLRDAGQISIETLREIGLRLQPKRTLPAAHSILRAA